MGKVVFFIVGTEEIVINDVVIAFLLHHAFPRIVMAPVFKTISLVRTGASALDIDVGIIGELEFDGVGRHQRTTFGAWRLLG